MSSSAIPAVFITNSNSLSTRPGGQQICTQEYVCTLQAAGFKLTTVCFDVDRRPWVRIRRKLWRIPYTCCYPPTLLDDVILSIRAVGARFVFLNLVELAPLAKALRASLETGCCIVLLSHGNESVDYLHTLRAKNGLSEFGRVTRYQQLTLARQLLAECNQRRDIDHVFCLSPFEAEIERWLGAKRVTWLPRTIPSCPLDWSPDFGRVGFVGTLDHPPTWEGLSRFLEAFDKLACSSGIVLRLVGGPAWAGSRLAKRFGCVENLGPLDNSELEQEARSWSCLVHPVFCYARGCSTKLAIGLGWQIPVVTTSAGCRGYMWREGNLPLGESPEAVAKLALQMTQPEAARQVRHQVATIVRSTPTLEEVANQVRTELFPATIGN